MADSHIRIKHAEPKWIHDFVEIYEMKFIQSFHDIFAEEREIRQTRYAMVHTNLMSLCFFLYADGKPISDIRQCMLKTIKVYGEVLRLRGSESSGRVEIDIPKDLSQPFDIGKAMEQAAMQTSSEKDFSLGNSNATLQAIFLALGINDLDAAKEFARDVWDPDEADYIGVGSEVCTPDQQHLAYAMRDCLLGVPTKAENELLEIINPPDESYLQAEMLGALIHRDGDQFLERLKDMLSWHALEAKKTDNVRVPEFLFCLPALGLTAYALMSEVITEAYVPSGNVYLPLEFFSQNVSPKPDEHI